MSASHNKTVVGRLFRAADAQNWPAMRALYQDDAIEEWPQSRERLKGVQNIMAVNENYAGHPAVRTVRILAEGDLVVGEAELDYSGAKYHLVSVFEFEDGLVKKEVDYFCQPFEPEEWRSQWVERI